jgi:hypothetical protein
MKFLPIIHNLHPTDPAWRAAQKYNYAIENKPKNCGTLAEKINALRDWKQDCAAALEEFKQAISN